MSRVFLACAIFVTACEWTSSILAKITGPGGEFRIEHAPFGLDDVCAVAPGFDRGCQTVGNRVEIRLFRSRS